MEKRDRVHNWKRSKQTSKEMRKAVKSNETAGLNTCLFSPASYPIVGSKSRKRLTEDEKEARWMRRVLANRESARETIRRRQTTLAELTRRSVDLELENENLKREREKAAHEYSLLKSTNDGLKAQIDEMMKDEEMMMKEKSRLHNAECLDYVSLTTPRFTCDQSSVLFNWPSFPQTSDASSEMFRPENGVATIVPMPQMWMPNPEQRNSVMIANPGTFFYVLPYPFLYPFCAPLNTLLPQTSELSDGQCQTSLVHQFGESCSSKTMIQEGNGESSFPLNSKPEAANPSKVTFAGEEAGCIISMDGGGEEDSGCFRRTVFPAAPISCVRPIACKRPFTSLHQGDCSNSEAITSVAYHTTDVMSEKSEGLKICPNVKPTEAVATTEARKRRKELMRLKNHQNCTF